MLPIGSLESLLRAVAEQAARGMRAVEAHGGQDRARRNAAAAAAVAGELRRERDATLKWLADHRP